MAEGARKTGNMGRFRVHPSLDAAVASLGTRQHAVFDLGQLRDLGLTASAIHKRATDGRLHHIHRAVYGLVPKALLTRNGLYMAAVLACGPGAMLSHRSAAALHGLREAGGTKIDVTVPRRGGRRSHEGMALHCSKTLTATDTTMVENIPCTTVARTLFDLAEVIPRRQVERAFDQAEVCEVFDLRAIQDQVARNPTRLACTVVRAILEEHYVGSTLTESELEEAMLALSRATDLPDPEVAVWLDLGDGEPAIKADFLWRAERLIVETDGRKYHGTRQAFERNRRRDQRLVVAGWRPIRTTERQLRLRPAELQATVAALVDRRAPRSG